MKWPEGWVFEEYGPCGLLARRGVRTIIVSDDQLAGTWWRHASISRIDKLPTYDDITFLHHIAWPEGGHAYQIFVPTGEHVNIHERCLHLWGRVDGQRCLPDFAGTLEDGGKTI